jgi:hypothetical protein
MKKEIRGREYWHGIRQIMDERKDCALQAEMVF